MNRLFLPERGAGPVPVISGATAVMLRRLLLEITLAVPDWMGIVDAVPVVPNRASETKDRHVLNLVRKQQAQYVQKLASEAERGREAAGACAKYVG